MRRAVLLAAAAATLLVGTVWSSTAAGSVANGRGMFLDDDGSIHEPDINGLARAGIARGCNPPANTNYCPHDPVTRAQMATMLVRALGLPPAATNPFTDTAGNIHQADIAALAQAGITRGCNPPANTNYCPHDPVTRAQMASFLVRALDDVSAERNRLSLRQGLTCAKDGVSCSARLTLARGSQLEIVEGWYQVTPYRGDEESAFKAAGTAVALSWNGNAVPVTYLGLSEAGSPATRLWQARLDPLTPGTHTLRGVWRWNGATAQTVTFVIIVP